MQPKADSLQRYFIAFSYHGKAFFGSQIQAKGRTVQGEMQRTLSLLTQIPDCTLTFAGRTDARVHAELMYAHWDAPKILDMREICYRWNAFLPQDISIKGFCPVERDAHARFDAISREYHYRFTEEKSPFSCDQRHRIPKGLDWNTLNQCLPILLEYQHFSAFERLHSDNKTDICSIQSIALLEEKEGKYLSIKADRFLRNMVRAIVGTLLQIGKGERNATDLRAIIESGDRTKAGPSAPAHGLFLVDIQYPFRLPLQTI